MLKKECMISSGYSQEMLHYITDRLNFDKVELYLENGKRFWKWPKLFNWTGQVGYLKIRAADVISIGLASDGDHGIRLRDHAHVTSAKFPDFRTKATLFLSSAV